MAIVDYAGSEVPRCRVVILSVDYPVPVVPQRILVMAIVDYAIPVVSQCGLVIALVDDTCPEVPHYRPVAIINSIHDDPRTNLINGSQRESAITQSQHGHRQTRDPIDK